MSAGLPLFELARCKPKRPVPLGPESIHATLQCSSGAFATPAASETIHVRIFLKNQRLDEKAV